MHRLRLPIAVVAAIVLLIPAAQAHAADPVIAAAGDIACEGLAVDPDFCQQQATSDLMLGQPLAAVLPLGDEQYLNGELGNFQQFYDPSWGRFKPITHPVPGNHEYQTRDATGYFQYFGAAAGPPNTGYYSYNVGSWHFVALNSNCAKIGSCAPSSMETKWLKADLAAHPAACTLAYWHQPHFSSGGAGDDDGGRNPTGAFWDVLYDGGADVVLNGHDHDYERFGLQDSDGQADPAYGIREIVAGTGGKSHTRFGELSFNSEVRDAGTYGVLEMTLHRASYDWRFIPAEGKTFTDVGTDRCHGSPNEPLLRLSGPRQRISTKGSLKVYAQCAAVCQARAQVTVQLRRRKIRSLFLDRTLNPQLRSSMRIKFAKLQLRAIRRAFKKHKRLPANLSVVAKSGDGNRQTVRLKLRLFR